MNTEFFIDGIKTRLRLKTSREAQTTDEKLYAEHPVQYQGKFHGFFFVAETMQQLQDTMQTAKVSLGSGRRAARISSRLRQLTRP